MREACVYNSLGTLWRPAPLCGILYGWVCGGWGESRRSKISRDRKRHRKRACNFVETLQKGFIGVRGLPARGIFFLGAMGLVPGQFGRFRLPPLKQEAFVFLKHTKQTIFLKKVLFLRKKKPLRARGWSLQACILYFFLKRCYFWGKKSPCGHAGGHSKLVFCKICYKSVIVGKKYQILNFS